jgi:uncharacterized protein
MILYLDTSALVKRYFRESYSEEVISKWQAATEIVTSEVAFAETMASIYRKKREAGLREALIRRIVESFLADWKSFIRVELTEDLNKYIHKIVMEHPLRGFDAIHLASARVVQEKLPEDFVFACFDVGLARAAQSEGFNTFPRLA